MSQQNDSRLKCRLCPWTTRRWRTLADGTKRHGSIAMAAHWEHAHYDDLMTVMVGLMALDASLDDEEG